MRPPCLPVLEIAADILFISLNKFLLILGLILLKLKHASDILFISLNKFLLILGLILLKLKHASRPVYFRDYACDAGLFAPRTLPQLGDIVCSALTVHYSALPQKICYFLIFELLTFVATQCCGFSAKHLPLL